MLNRPVSSLATAALSAYARNKIEHTFDARSGSETGHVVQNPTEFTPRLLTIQSSQRAGSPASREELFAVKTAQMVADDIAESALDAMTLQGDEFCPASFILTTARAAAGWLSEALEPLNVTQRAMVVDRAVDPTYHDESLDLILDGIGRMLHAFAQRFTTGHGDWTCVREYGCDYLEQRVVAWQAPDGFTELHLLDFNVATASDWGPSAEVRDICALMYRVFGCATLTVYPAHSPAQARFYVEQDEWYLLTDDGSGNVLVCDDDEGDAA